METGSVGNWGRLRGVTRAAAPHGHRARQRRRGVSSSPNALVELARIAERAGLDFVSLDDGFDPRTRPARRPARAGPHRAGHDLDRARRHRSRRPTPSRSTSRRTSPRSTSCRGGRAGWRVAVSTSDEAATRFGRKRARSRSTSCTPRPTTPSRSCSRLWDSWEDDAVIRDQPTGRYIDRDKVHYIDFEGPLLQRPRPVDHAAVAAGPAARRRHGDDDAVDERSLPAAPTSCSSTATPTRACSSVDASDGRCDARSRAPRLERCSSTRPARRRGDAGESPSLDERSRAASADGFLHRARRRPTTFDVVRRPRSAPPRRATHAIAGITLVRDSASAPANRTPREDR